MDNNKRIEDALDNHFPESDIAVYPMQHFKGSYHVSVKETDFNFGCIINNNFLREIQSKNDCFEAVQKSLNILLPSQEKIECINHFIRDFYNNGNFNKIFEMFSLIANESMYKTTQDEESNYAIFHSMSDPSKSNCRLDKKNYSIFLNCYFKMTKDRKLLAVPTLSFFNGNGNPFKFEISFNLENQTAHFVKSHPMYYDDFFEDNKIFDFTKDLDFVFKKFIDENVMKHIDPTNELGRQLESLEDDIDEKIKLLLMYSI
jgi:hypothetical protein